MKFFWYKFLARISAQLYSTTDTVQHVTWTVQRDWPESCFGARNCDELVSIFWTSFWCKFLVLVSWACVAGIVQVVWYKKLARVSANVDFGTSIFWYKFLAHNWTQLYSSTETVRHMTRTMHRDWLESCFGAGICDELASYFTCKYVVQVSWVCRRHNAYRCTPGYDLRKFF